MVDSGRLSPPGPGKIAQKLSVSLRRSRGMFTPAGIGMHRKRLLAVAIFSLMAFCYEVVAASQLATEQPPIAEPTPTPSVAPSDAPQKASYSSCRVDGPYIAMTFDDGPHPVLTPRLLDVLKARGIKATFFLIGQNAAEYPDIVRRIAAEGHEIGNHTWGSLHIPAERFNPRFRVDSKMPLPLLSAFDRQHACRLDSNR